MNGPPVQFEWPSEALDEAIDRLRDHLVIDVIPRLETMGTNWINLIFDRLGRVKFNGGVSTK